jgi:nicotinamidase-related amidase
MQPCFQASKNIINQCKKQLNRAKYFHWPIIWVEYAGYEATAKELLEHAKGLKTYRVLKHLDDGSDDILITLQKHNLNNKLLRICGVNTSACVHKTVQGLSNKINSTIEIVREACNQPDYFPLYNCEALCLLGSIKNVKLI